MYVPYYAITQARYWGLAKVTIQALMVAVVVNLKHKLSLLKVRSPALSWASAL